MGRRQDWRYWWDHRPLTPAYSGWLLMGLGLFFFGAATNTLSGWLYVLSGVIIALLGLAAWFSWCNLRGLTVKRHLLEPVTAGDSLQVQIQITNQTTQTKSGILIEDRLPTILGPVVTGVLEEVRPRTAVTWSYQQPVARRGVYRWQTLELRTAAPLGLFWSARSQVIPTTAVVYPPCLPLSHCPLLARLGQATNPRLDSQDRRSQVSNEGLVRSLRPYRWGDSTRLIHWRSSAHTGVLQIRELEIFSRDQAVVIALDTATTWDPTAFEQAVVAAATLWSYAHRRGSPASLWTAGQGLVSGRHLVLSTLAAVQPQEPQTSPPLSQPLVWLTSSPHRLTALNPGSCWLLWSNSRELGNDPVAGGLVMDWQQPLSPQLQRNF